MVILVTVLGTACGPTRTYQQSVKSAEELSEVKKGASAVVVFGRVRWLENGEEAIGTAAGKTVTLGLYDIGQDKYIDGRVGSDGLFSWVLEPGEYHVLSTQFHYLMSAQLGPAYFHLSVPEGQGPVYTGTLTIETTLKSSWTGWKLSVDRFSMSNDCEDDCPTVLARLDLSADTMQVSLLQYDEQIAQRWAKAQE
jgi:hypothetical protein